MTAELTIGQLARKARVNVETIRYYQRRGLVRTPRRPPEGFRHYTPDVLDRLRFIKRAQQLGFTLSEIAELLKLGDGACRETRRVAEQKQADIARRIRDLEAMHKTLTGLVARCRGKRNPGCPIIETLSGTEVIIPK